MAVEVEFLKNHFKTKTSQRDHKEKKIFLGDFFVFSV